ncbi:MAG: vWA domain-containing protein [Planctomycetota bacterium]
MDRRGANTNRRRTLPRAGAWLAALAACGLALGAWLAAPLHGSGSGRPLRIAAFDGSASVVRTRPGFETWMRECAEAERGRAQSSGADFAALVFAGDCAWWSSPGSARRELGPAPRSGDGLQTDLAAALELARAASAAAGSSGGVVRLFSDLRSTGPAIEASLRALREGGLRVECAELAAPELDDLELISLSAPRRLERSAPLACKMRVRGEWALQRTDSARRVRVEFRLSGAAPEATLAFERELSASEAIWRFELGAAPAGGVRIAARVFLDRDPIPENDAASVWVEVGGALEIAVVTAQSDPDSERAQTAFVTDAERWPGLAFLPTSPAELPAALAHVQAVLTLNVASHELPVDLLREFLDAGGGWLDCSGSAALHGESPLAEDRTARVLLPLRPRPPERKPRDVLLLIDGSGSMAGAAFEAVRAAAITLAEAVPSRDRVLLAFFTRELEPASLVRDANRAGSGSLDLTLLLRERRPSGGTDVIAALDGLARSRSGADPETLALLLSDGRDPEAGRNLDLAALRARLAQARVELAVFAFGPDAELGFLASLLPAGRELTRVEDPRQLGVLFARSVAAERMRTDTAVIASPAEASQSPAALRELSVAMVPGAPGGLDSLHWI